MSKVMVNGKIYEIVEAPTTDIETVYSHDDTLQAFPILAVTGTGRSVENGSLYEIVWYLDEQDKDKLDDDASDWVSDWNTADDAVELED